MKRWGEEEEGEERGRGDAQVATLCLGTRGSLVRLQRPQDSGCGRSGLKGTFSDGRP